jgi:hypothetical protein
VLLPATTGLEMYCYMKGACNKTGRREKYIKMFVAKPERKRQNGKPRCRWEDY